MNLDIPIREKVNAAEAYMKQQPQVALFTVHYFFPGGYAREIHIPAGTILTGKIHKYAQFNVLSKGKMAVLVGEEIQTVEAPFSIVSPPGTKRIAYTHSDCVWTTVHGTEETDLDKIEEHFIAQDEQEYLEFCRKQLEKN